MIFNSLDDIRDDRTCKALTGLTKDQFKELLEVFQSSFHALRQERYQQGELRTPQVGGRAGYLATFAHKLFFVLYYLKNYPPYDVLGYLFGFGGGHAHDHLQRLLPILQCSLADLKHLPVRAFAEVKELEQSLEGEEKIIIDAVERSCVRPQDEARQKACYSGKKTPHNEESGYEQSG